MVTIEDAKKVLTELSLAIKEAERRPDRTEKTLENVIGWVISQAAVNPDYPIAVAACDYAGIMKDAVKDDILEEVKYNNDLKGVEYDLCEFFVNAMNIWLKVTDGSRDQQFLNQIKDYASHIVNKVKKDLTED